MRRIILTSLATSILAAVTVMAAPLGAAQAAQTQSTQKAPAVKKHKKAKKSVKPAAAKTTPAPQSK